MEFLEKNKNLLIGIGVVLVVVAGVLWLRSGNDQEPEVPSVTETFVEEGEFVEETDGQRRVLSEEEKEQLKQKINQLIADDKTESTVLNPVSGQGQGQAYKAVEAGKYYFKYQVSGLKSPSKGYFYQAWVEGEEGPVSLGRLEMIDGEGVVYYMTNQDLSAYHQAMVTLEPEDGEEAPAEVVLKGSF